MPKKQKQKKLSPKKSEIYDVLILGGGIAGLTLTALLGTEGFRVLCLDREKIPDMLRPEFDGRTTAISYASRQVLDRAGVWAALHPLSCPIKDIRIMDGSPVGAAPVLLQFLSSEVEDKDFGFIVENRDLRRALLSRINELDSITHIPEAEAVAIHKHENEVKVTLKDGREFAASLLVGADGRNSLVRKYLNVPEHGWTYDQNAIVCVVAHEFPHQNIAIEHFRAEGPFAILPMRDDEGVKGLGRYRSSLVWTIDNTKDNPKNSPIHYTDDVFNAALQARFPPDYGRVKLAGPRFSYPLSLQHAHRYVGDRMVVLAEAAHVMHPIAGQGLNIGMRDLATLADILLQSRAQHKDCGAAEILTTYQRARHFDTTLMVAATDGLNRLFSNDIPGLGPLRRAGLRMIQKLPRAKQFFMKQAMGLGAIRK